MVRYCAMFSVLTWPGLICYGSLLDQERCNFKLSMEIRLFNFYSVFIILEWPIKFIVSGCQYQSMPTH